MRVVCVDASDNRGTGTGLLTEGKEYEVGYQQGGYYQVLCDNGKVYSKYTNRFKLVQTVKIQVDPELTSRSTND